ncbi:hypothetical protein LNJ05_00645 [Tenacibaculum finnmarkense genomovar ulcerans]|nr:hypothetical protein [Tenacibaculum finnmarkense]ALU75527.1 hypothetical protein AUW17_09745 [Tenacibaculum dicentrarchi]MCD8399802.1 hypothetical protein [Tenacibaculum finnmarkense genomovar ulcerans]MCD8422061.1 hypothetical protein [Tenacibaculum finnmarkense genomovar ulcerans]MCD8428804.1 hypothetical protein [Tenacibaculum finnmarkense genomovar ulcerans]MCD8431273.1 hypothetical protein [Tenacibaculum finnmarkense genomovar ulcerans]
MIFISKFLIPKGFVGLTLFPFIFLKRKELKDNYILINHEKIHLKQQLELLVIFFYLFYGIEWLIKCFKYKNGYLAYKNISFERESYQNEDNLYYLESRKKWAFIHYL